MAAKRDPVDEAAEELYGLPPGEFTRARDERAKKLRKSGDREAADAVKALRKPTVAAWALDQLARQRGKELGRLLTAGEGLRGGARARRGTDGRGARDRVRGPRARGRRPRREGLGDAARGRARRGHRGGAPRRPAGAGARGDRGLRRTHGRQCSIRTEGPTAEEGESGSEGLGGRRARGAAAGRRPHR